MKKEIINDLDELENLMCRIAPEKRAGINTPLYILAKVLRDILLVIIHRGLV